MFYEFDEFVSGMKLNGDSYDLIKKAYDIAVESLSDKKRISGAPFATHVFYVARKVYDLNMDPYSIILSLLHHSYYGKYINIINKKFPEKIIEQLKMFNRIPLLKKVAKDYKFTYANIRNILIAISYDVRVIIVEIVNKMHNVITSKLVSKKEEVKDAIDSIEIYANLSQKFGINELSGIFEDYALKVLFPDKFNSLKNEIKETRNERMRKVSQIMDNISDLLKANKINAEITGRAKHFYSILKKIEKGKKLDDIYDLFAVRIITKSVSDCYKVTEIIKSTYQFDENRFKDYISHPKDNGYQSIHMTVKNNDTIFEIQIRTKEMNTASELGLAAHWRYKNLDIGKFDRYIEWSRQSISVMRSQINGSSIIDSANIELFGNSFFTFTPKGDPIELPKGSTIIDFAFRIHTYLGMHVSYARVDGFKKPLNYIIMPGDIVEIISSPNIQAKEKWLLIAKTKEAKYKLRNYFGLRLKPNLKQGVEHRHADLIDFKNKFTIGGCCKDIKYGDKILALKTKSGWVVHKTECENVSSVYKTIKLGWKKIPYNIKIHCNKSDDVILVKILTQLKDLKLKVKQIEADAVNEDNYDINITVESLNKIREETLKNNILNVSNDIKKIEISEKF